MVILLVFLFKTGNNNSLTLCQAQLIDSNCLFKYFLINVKVPKAKCLLLTTKLFSQTTKGLGIFFLRIYNLREKSSNKSGTYV